jgi:hypothetical protein
MTRERLSANSRNYIPKGNNSRSIRETQFITGHGKYFTALAKSLGKLHILYFYTYLCVPYGSHNKQQLFPQTALTGWVL